MRSGHRKLIAGLMTAVLLLMGTAAAVPFVFADAVDDWMSLYQGYFYKYTLTYTDVGVSYMMLYASNTPIVWNSSTKIMSVTGTWYRFNVNTGSSGSGSTDLNWSTYPDASFTVGWLTQQFGEVEYYNAITGQWVPAVKEGTPVGYPRYRIDTKRDIKVRVKGYELVTVFGQVNGTHVADDQAVGASDWTEFTIPSSTIEWRYTTSAWVYGGGPSDVPVSANGEQWLIPIEYSVEGVYGFFQNVSDGFKFYEKTVTFSGGVFNRPVGATYHVKITREITGELVDYRNLQLDNYGAFNVTLSIEEEGEYRLVLVQDMGGTLTVLQELHGFIGAGYVPDDGGPAPDANIFEQLIWWVSTPIREASRLLGIAVEGVQSLVDPAGPLLSMVSMTFAWMPNEIKTPLVSMIVVGVVIAIIGFISTFKR